MVAPACPVGTHRFEVRFDTDDPVYRSLVVPVTVTIRPARRVQATAEAIRLTLGGDTASDSVRLRDRDDEAVVIDRIEGDRPGLSTRFAPGPGRLATARVTLDARQLPPEGECELRIHVSGPVAEVIPLRVSWQTGRAGP